MALLAKYMWPTGIQEFGGFVKPALEDRKRPSIATSDTLPDPVWTTGSEPVDGSTSLALPFYDITPFYQSLLQRGTIAVRSYTEYKFKEEWWAEWASGSTYVQGAGSEADLYIGLRESGYVEYDSTAISMYMLTDWSDASRPDYGNGGSTIQDMGNGRIRLNFFGSTPRARGIILNSLSLTTPETARKDSRIELCVLTQATIPPTDPNPLYPENVVDPFWIGYATPPRPVTPDRSWPTTVPATNFRHIIAVNYMDEGLAYHFKGLPDLLVDNTANVYAGVLGRDTVAATYISLGSYRYQTSTAFPNIDGTNTAAVSAPGLRAGKVWAVEPLRGNDPSGGSDLTWLYRSLVEPRTKSWGRENRRPQMVVPTAAATFNHPKGWKIGYLPSIVYRRPSDSAVFANRRQDFRKYLEGDWDFLAGNFTLSFEYQGAGGDGAAVSSGSPPTTQAAGGTGFTLMSSSNGALWIKLVYDANETLNQRLQIVYNGVEITQAGVGPPAPTKWNQTRDSNTFVHLAFVKNGTSWMLFKDGAKVQEGTLTQPALTAFAGTEMILGGNHTNDPESSWGYMRNIKFWRLVKYNASFTKPAFPDWK